MTKTSNIPPLAQGRFIYGITCEFNTHRKFPQTDFPEGLGVYGGERGIYIQTHTAAFLNSDMASKAEQKTSVSSIQQSPAPICHPFSREDYCFNMLSSHHLFCIQWANQTKKKSIYTIWFNPDPCTQPQKWPFCREIVWWPEECRFP